MVHGPRTGTTRLAVDFCGLRLANPVVAAAGTCGYVGELRDCFDTAQIGAITSKSITREVREGNAPWRMWGIPGGMLNAIGLANVGVERFLREKLPDAGALGCPLFASIAGHSIDDYVAVALRFDDEASIPVVELNVSCPNTSDGLQFGEHPASLRTLLAAVRPALARTKLVVKLSPNVGDIVGMAKAAIDGGADALTLINTVSAMGIDVETRRPLLSRGTGGLSGPAVHAIAVRMVHQVHRAVARDAGIPIIGLGGVSTWHDAAEFILAGATLVGIGTGLFVDPRTPLAVVDGLDRWVERQGCRSVSELVGAVVL
jgi:dihydroorotate dehydrogenase (NAD+) catalytic subunit